MKAVQKQYPAATINTMVITIIIKSPVVALTYIASGSPQSDRLSVFGNSSIHEPNRKTRV
jgi:hypothetical protein